MKTKASKKAKEKFMGDLKRKIYLHVHADWSESGGIGQMALRQPPEGNDHNREGYHL